MAAFLNDQSAAEKRRQWKRVRVVEERQAVRKQIEQPRQVFGSLAWKWGAMVILTLVSELAALPPPLPHDNMHFYYTY